MATRKSTTHPALLRTFTPEFADEPFRIAFERGTGYVVVDVDSGGVRAEFDGDKAGHTAAYELAAELNHEHAADVADSEALLSELRAQADAEDAARAERDERLLQATIEAYGHNPADWGALYAITTERNPATGLFAPCITWADGRIEWVASYADGEEQARAALGLPSLCSIATASSPLSLATRDAVAQARSAALFGPTGRLLCLHSGKASEVFGEMEALRRGDDEPDDCPEGSPDMHRWEGRAWR